MRITSLALAALAGAALLFIGPQAASAGSFEDGLKHELGHVAIGVGLGVVQQVAHGNSYYYGGHSGYGHGGYGRSYSYSYPSYGHHGRYYSSGHRYSGYDYGHRRHYRRGHSRRYYGGHHRHSSHCGHRY